MIRPLTPADVSAFIRLRYAAFASDPLSFDHEPGSVIDPEVWAPRLAEVPDQKFTLGYFLTEGRSEPELAGMIGLLRYEKKKRSHRALVWGVYVGEAARGRGAADRLLEECIRRAREMVGLDRLVLSLSHHAGAARHLYEKHGFVVFGREPGAARTGETAMDEIHMLLDL
ncbi:MAG: GNAT family N-acetyltransferase [Bacteroidota bacterium]